MLRRNILLLASAGMGGILAAPALGYGSAGACSSEPPCPTPRPPAELAVRRYAEIFITCEQGWARVFSAADGLYLGLAPVQVPLTKGRFPRDDVVALFFERRGYQSLLRLARVPAWFPTRAEATHNQIKFMINLSAARGFVADDARATPNAVVDGTP